MRVENASHDAWQLCAPDSKRRGQAIVEFALMAPWLFFLFVGALDFGFYAHALISTQNAARAAALYTSSSDATAADTANACLYAWEALKSNPNVPALTPGTTPTCSSAPVTLTSVKIAGADAPDYDPANPVKAHAASRVTVVYQTAQLIPIPGLVPGQITITKTVTMRLRS